MKAGRPTYRVKAKWVTFQGPEDETFFELDQRGELIKVNKKELKPHHTKKISCLPESLSIADYIKSVQTYQQPAVVPSAPLPSIPNIETAITVPEMNKAYSEMDFYFNNSIEDDTVVSDFADFIVF